MEYKSPCDGQDGEGDSIPNTPGVGDLIPSSLCPFGEGPTKTGCEHGTHVAGILIGRPEPGSPTNVKGIANGANLGSLRISSYPTDKTQSLRSFLEDITSALEYLMDLAKTSPEGSVLPFVVNISQSAGWYTNPCPDVISPGAIEAVALLNSRGIPVIAGTGNELVGRKYAIGWPSCVPGVIAAGAVNNDGAGPTAGLTRWSGSNISNPQWMTNKTIFMAPGAPVVSSIPGGYQAASGTSQAAPHVAGLYAVVKQFAPGLDNLGITNLIKGAAKTYQDQVCDNANTPSVDPINTCHNETFWRVHMP